LDLTGRLDPAFAKLTYWLAIMRSLVNFLLMFLIAAGLSAATVDGIKIHSSSSGQGPKTVILVHGWTCDETTWSAQVPALSKDYRVITLDLPGHGRTGSPKDGNLSMDLLARAVEAVREESKADRVVLVGHSMGTAVVIRYASLYPRHTAAMVFVDGYVGLPATTASDASQMRGPEGLKAREALVRTMFSVSTTPEMQKRILSMMLAAPESTAAMDDFAPLKPGATDVFTQPVLGIYADHSRTANPEYRKTHFSNMDYREIAGTGHFLMIEKPDEFNRLLLAFLAKQKF
jgi:pimeloyl-ACP methyl ester carboxylesterase